MVKYNVNTHGRIENFYSEYHDYLSHIFFEGNLRCKNQNVTNLGLIWMEGGGG